MKGFHSALILGTKVSQSHFLCRPRRIISGSVVCRSLQWGIFIGRSSFYTWDRRRRCLSILVTFQSLLPTEWSLYTGRSVVPFSERLNPSQLQLQPQYLVHVWRLPDPRICGIQYTLRCMVITKMYRHFFIFGLDCNRKWICTLLSAECSGRFAFRIS